ncbi:hypothetical protein [Frateuria defendens]|uniref:hypothetical protein n=1 Tax=Frateuria defendens TaxID=2219559 RepID=UPI00066FF421|nr:hypothetical protein [Frateuria defendens]
MSEYQYYEFAAIDRPLTRTEMAELRAVSTRAVITPTRFTNHYEWGDLKANPDDWMRRYFDAFVYLANWCTCQLSLRLPKADFCKAELQPFASRSTLSVNSSSTHWILHWTLDESEDDDRFATDDGSGWMRRLAPLRDELLRGDLRSLYLGWLAGANSLDDDALEPEVPPDLAELSSAQQALAEFLEIDPDLLEAARVGSTASPPLGGDEAQRMAAWLDTWQAPNMKDVLKRIALGQGQEAERQVKSHYAAWLKAQCPISSPDSPRRCVAELRELARSAATVRREREARAREAREAEQRRQHETYLRSLMRRCDQYWKQADSEATRGVASGYERAAHLLSTLAEGYALVSSRKAFDRELRRFLVPHARRAALLRRLTDAGLWSG